MISVLLIILTTTTSLDSSQVPENLKKHPLESKIGREKAEIASGIEDVLQSYGINERLSRAAVINALAESGLNPTIVGDNGHSVGIFQLNDRGLGNKMSVEQRKNTRKSSEKIARTLLKDKYIMNLSRSCADLEFLVEQFARRIMRPSNIELRVVERRKLAKNVMKGLPDNCKS